MSRRLLAPLAVLVALTLAACGSDTPPANDTAPPADSAPATTPVTPPPAN